MKVSVIIVAGGSGSRMGGGVPKQFLELAGRPVLAHTVERFADALPDADIVVALPAEHIDRWGEIAAAYDLRCKVCAGGATRFDTVKRALGEVAQSDYIMVHDGVRPLVSAGLITSALAAAKASGAAVPAVMPVDSFREVLGEGSRPVDRSLLRAVQTPQAFRADILRRAYQTEYADRFTDDASVVESGGVAVTLCEGERSNIKITTPEDMIIAEAILKSGI